MGVGASGPGTGTGLALGREQRDPAAGATKDAEGGSYSEAQGACVLVVRQSSAVGNPETQNYV